MQTIHFTVSTAQTLLRDKWLIMQEAPPDWDFDDEFDGGEESCGRVIINLHLYLKTLETGSRVLVILKDPAALLELRGLR